jgi:hypothetical protein
MEGTPAVNLRDARGKAKAAAYASVELRMKASAAAKAFGVKPNSVYHAARRCGLRLPASQKGPIR